MYHCWKYATKTKAVPEVVNTSYVKMFGLLAYVVGSLTEQRLNGKLTMFAIDNEKTEKAPSRNQLAGKRQRLAQQSWHGLKMLMPLL